MEIVGPVLLLAVLITRARLSPWLMRPPAAGDNEPPGAGGDDDEPLRRTVARCIARGVGDHDTASAFRPC